MLRACGRVRGLCSAPTQPLDGPMLSSRAELSSTPLQLEDRVLIHSLTSVDAGS